MKDRVLLVCAVLTLSSHFESIGWVGGNGTSSIAQYYSFEDESPQQGRNYYRLHQKDFDGKQEYSKVIAVDFNGEPGFKLFPNPSLGDITIRYPQVNNELAQVKITDVKGSAIDTFILQQSPGKFQIYGLTPGFYIATVTSGNKTSRKKIHHS